YRGDQPALVALQDLGFVRVPEAACVGARAARAAGVERDARGGRAADGDVAVVDLDALDRRSRRAVERSGSKRVEHGLACPLPRAHPCPREAGVVPRVVRIVGRDPVHAPAALERLVPLERRVAAPRLELAPRVPDLDPDETFARLPLLRPQTAPVRVREV